MAILVENHWDLTGTSLHVPLEHKTSHETGGSDELSVLGLSGLLADSQTPLWHKTGHENGGTDEISVLGLSGLLADSQTPLVHKTSHQNSGSDELNVAGLSGLLADEQDPTAHASEHTDGTDDIQDATAAQKGLVTAVQITKLDGIEALADVTDAINVNAAGATMNTDADVKANTWVIDEDSMVSDLDTKVPTQQSVKAYADALVPVPAAHAASHQNGGGDEISVLGLSGLLADNQNPTAHASEHTDGTDDIQNATALQKGVATAVQITKLDGIEALADVTDTANVTAAGAAIAGGAFHDGFSDFVANEHIDHSGVDVTAGTGLTGGGSIAATRTLAVDVGITDDKIMQVDDADAADNDYAKFTAAGLEGRSYTEVRSDINVADGADVTGSNAPQAHAASHIDGTDDIQNATAAQKGVATAAQITKLDGIEALADVTATHTSADSDLLNGIDPDFYEGRTRGGSGPDPDSTLYHLIMTNHANGPDGGTSYWYIRTQWYGTVTAAGNSCQIAIQYSPITSPDVYVRSRYGGTYGAWNRCDSGAAPITHAASHQNGGGDEISVAGLSGELADDQPPKAHATDHQSGGGDAIKLDNLAAPDDNTDLNASAAAHGLLPKLNGAPEVALLGTGAWGNPTAAAHAASHTDGTDDIQSATAAQKGVATAAQITKLDGIEALADVTDATNVAAAGAVMDTGNETVAGIKTFSSFPVTPSAAPTTDYQAANKKYVDDAGGGGGLYSDYIMVSDQKAANTHGGTFTSGAWRTRDITTEDADTGGDCSISSNQITLAAGTYRCLIRAPGNDVDRHVIRLRNTSDGATTLVGSAVNASSSANEYNDSVLQGRFTIAAQKTFEVQHYSETSKTTTGFGQATNFAAHEIYTVAEFWKEA